MLDRIIGIAALAVLGGFVGILVGFVPDVDLMLVVTIPVILAGYDFYLSLFRARDGGR